MLVATRALAGLFGGSISTAQAYVADVTSPNERARYMGFLGASIGAGFVFGPALGSLMAPLGFSAATWVASGLALFNAVLTYRRVPESAPAAARRPSGRSALPLARLRGVGLRSVSAQVAISMFFSTWAFVAMETTFPLLGERRFGLTERSLGWVLTYVGVVVVVVQGKLLYAVVRRRGEVATALLGGALMAGSLLGLSFAHTLSTSLLALGGLSAGQGLLSPSLTALLSKVAGAEDRGGVLGMGQGLAALARAVGPVVSGWLFDLNPASPYWLAAAFVLIALANLARLPIPQPHVETEFVAAPET
jgi:MFS family permease